MTMKPRVGNPTTSKRVKRLEAAPGKFIQSKPTDTPTAGTFNLIPNGDGNYRIVHRLHQPLERLNRDTAPLIGRGLDYRTLLRLGTAEPPFIKILRASPATTLLDTASLDAHLKAVAADPWFWEHAANIERYRRALGC
jgi:hypothetical protein